MVLRQCWLEVQKAFILITSVDGVEMEYNTTTGRKEKKPLLAHHKSSLLRVCIFPTFSVPRHHKSSLARLTLRRAADQVTRVVHGALQVIPHKDGDMGVLPSPAGAPTITPPAATRPTTSIIVNYQDPPGLCILLVPHEHTWLFSSFSMSAFVLGILHNVDFLSVCIMH